MARCAQMQKAVTASRRVNLSKVGEGLAQAPADCTVMPRSSRGSKKRTAHTCQGHLAVVHGTGCACRQGPDCKSLCQVHCSA